MEERKITYEIIYKDIQSKEEYITTGEYKDIESCKKDFGLYTSNIEKVIGVKKIEHIEKTIDMKDL
ncbi:hypothetical protein [Clostridium sp. M14]|uniref:hypothetical protein n=1 Tax=Clostridium sp. M14 TaxID=2716311 RepID=UPI0013EE6BAA|nr:hypothetical protein [Clostridium sp. M14]MBZ9693357.1 hypothetical protein [Clostridium sp. M14]